MTDLVIFSHSREKKSSPYSLINMGMFYKNLDVCYKIYLHLLGFFSLSYNQKELLLFFFFFFIPIFIFLISLKQFKF